MKRYLQYSGALIESATGNWMLVEDHEAEVARLVPLKGGVPVREWALQENLKLAEEGLANYAQELEGAKHDIERLMAVCTAEANEVERLQGERAAAIDRLTPLGCENAELRALLTQAPIAKVVVREGCAHYAPDDVSVSLYAPGLPPGEYDLYLMPDVPQSEQRSTTEESK